MKLSEAIKIIDYSVDQQCPTKEEQLEAEMVFWKDLLGVTINNPDGSYKSMYSILQEAAEKFNSIPETYPISTEDIKKLLENRRDKQ